MLKETKQTRKALDDALSKHCTIGEESNTVHATGQVSVGHAIDDPKPRDADEQALYHQYKVDLWKMRAQKAMGVFIKPVTAEIVVPTIQKEPEIPVKAVVCSSTPATAEIVVPTIKKEPEIPVQAVAAEIVVPTITKEPCEFSELDEFSQACYFIL